LFWLFREVVIFGPMYQKSQNRKKIRHNSVITFFNDHEIFRKSGPYFELLPNVCSSAEYGYGLMVFIGLPLVLE